MCLCLCIEHTMGGRYWHFSGSFFLAHLYSHIFLFVFSLHSFRPSPNTLFIYLHIFSFYTRYNCCQRANIYAYCSTFRPYMHRHAKVSARKNIKTHTSMEILLLLKCGKCATFTVFIFLFCLTMCNIM